MRSLVTRGQIEFLVSLSYELKSWCTLKGSFSIWRIFYDRISVRSDILLEEDNSDRLGWPWRIEQWRSYRGQRLEIIHYPGRGCATARLEWTSADGETICQFKDLICSWGWFMSWFGSCCAQPWLTRTFSLTWVVRKCFHSTFPVLRMMYVCTKRVAKIERILKNLVDICFQWYSMIVEQW